MSRNTIRGHKSRVKGWGEASREGQKRGGQVKAKNTSKGPRIKKKKVSAGFFEGKLEMGKTYRREKKGEVESRTVGAA